MRDTPLGRRRRLSGRQAAAMRPGPDPSTGATLGSDHALDRLRVTGHRMTVARRAVIDVLAGYGGHPTAEELCAEIETRVPGVHRATVYRTLETLAKLGVIRHVHMGHGTTAYHLVTAASGPEHLLAQCRACGVVIDLPGALLDAVGTEIAGSHGFLLEPRHVALSGTCAAC
jgi:Fur family ferric uptake transcriptional regulator